MPAEWLGDATATRARLRRVPAARGSRRRAAFAEEAERARGATERRSQYAILRVVPRVERGECVNAGVVLFCRRRRFLAARVDLDERRLRALAPDLDPRPSAAHLDALDRDRGGRPGRRARSRALPPSERFRWLVAPSSTIVQPSPVHTGLCDDPQTMLDRLFDELVAPVA